jgi:uncharacterized iron-regulated membrane protein
MRLSYALSFGAVILSLQIPIGFALGYTSYWKRRQSGADGRRGSRVRPGSALGWKRRSSIGSTLRCGVSLRRLGAGRS